MAWSSKALILCPYHKRGTKKMRQNQNRVISLQHAFWGYWINMFLEIFWEMIVDSATFPVLDSQSRCNCRRNTRIFGANRSNCWTMLKNFVPSTENLRARRQHIFCPCLEVCHEWLRSSFHRLGIFRMYLPWWRMLSAPLDALTSLDRFVPPGGSSGTIHFWI